jgi:hypothetical protein
MNIVSTIMQFLTPMITNKIASSLGMNNTLVNTAIGALLPAILAGLAGKASTPAGAAALSSTLANQDSNLLGSFAGMLGGAGQNALINNGTSALSGLLGGSATNALSGALGKFTGVDQKSSGSLIGMLAPVILGQLAQTQKSSGLDAGGLAKMLEGQKGNIAAAIPPGFSDLLKGSGLLDSVTGSARTAAPVVDAPRMPSVTPAPSFNWIPWAVGAVALATAFFVFGNKPTPVAVTPAAKVTTPASPAIVTPTVPTIAANTEALDQAKKLISGLTSALGGIKDEASAKAALPQLTSSSTALDMLAKLTGGLAPAAKSPVIAMIEAAVPQLKPLIEAALKIPGAEAVLKPVLDGIMSKMIGFSKA